MTAAVRVVPPEAPRPQFSAEDVELLDWLTAIGRASDLLPAEKAARLLALREKVAASV